MDIINAFKYRYFKQLASVNSLANNWNIWGSEIQNLIDDENWGESAFNIGDHLSDVFLSTNAR